MATSYRERMLNSTKKEPTTNDAVSVNTSYRQRLLNSENKNNQPTQSVAGKMDSLWVESTAPNVLQKQNINATVKPVNISDFVKGVKNTAEQNKLKVEEDIAKAGYKSSDFTEDQKKQLISGNYSINPTYNPNNKFSQKIIYTGDANIKATPSLGQSVANVAEKTGRTAMDLTAAAATGVVRGYEGLTDVAIGNVGNFASQVTSLGGLKPNNVSENIRKGTEKIVGYGLAGEMDKLAAEKRAEGAGSYNPNILGMGARDIVSEGARMFSLAPLGMPGFIGSAAGNNIEQAINEGEKLPNAVMYGNITGTIEGATEKLFDTFNVIGGGKLDKFLPKKAIAKFVLGASGEGVEEMISQAVNPFTKMLTYEQNVENPFGSWENFINYCKDVGEAGLQGFAMGMFMQGVHDISSSDIRNQYKTEVTSAVNKIKGIAENSKQAIVDGMMAGASRFKIPSNSQINGAQNQAQIQNNKQTNVTLPNQTEMAQNANMEQITDNNKNKLLNKIKNNQYMSQEEKNDLIATVNNTNITSEVETEINNILNTINEEFGLKNITSDFNSNKAKYAQYVNDKSDMDNSYIDNSKNAIDTKDGRRTKDQWLSIAKNLGSQIYEMSDAEIEKYAYRTWIENKPNNVQNLNRQGKKYIKFGLDEWVNTVYDSVRETRNRVAEKPINTLPTQKAQQTLQSAKNDNFHKGLEKFNSKKYTQTDDMVVLDETPQYLYNLGFDADKPLVINMSKLATIMKEPKGTFDGKNQHGITMDVVEQLPKALQNPLNVIKNPKHNERVVVVTELTDQYGDIIIVPIEMNTDGYIENIENDVNRINTVYGKENYDIPKEGNDKGYIQYNEDKIIYDIDKDITKKRDINSDYRLQLPSTAINTSNNSINQNDLSVNTEYAQNNKNDTTYISPVSDIQSATKFVEKATVNDIETLQKMVDEAEKNPDRIDLQFFAEKARETIEKLSRQQVRQAIMEETGLDNYNLDDINKISKAKMNFTTPIRVIEKVFNKETANRINENFFKPIKHNEAERIRRLNKERNDIKELDIKPGSAEDAAIQKFGEGEYVDASGLTIPYTLENLKQDFPESWQKLQKATNVIRNKYDTYLEEINEVLKDNGYDPIPKRKDYFRHFEELNDLFSILGVPTKVDDIPTDLNGMTADLKPGKQFFANALQRKGNKTTYSAIKGIDGYLDGAMNMLYHTKDIQKLRTLEKYIRDTYGAKKGLEEASEMTDEQKNKRINQINEGHLSEFAAWLMEYTNALAGKKSRLDRGIEEMFGRKAYKYLNLIKKQVGANMTGLNVNSALSNFISVTQAAPKTSKKALVKGTVDTVKNIFNNDGFIDKSDFLTTRFGSDKLAKNWWQKAGDVGQIFMSGTDYFTANLITRSKYQELLDKGYTETEAMKKADEFADRLMAGRGKGDLPTAFESKMLGIVTQFQLEVTNQLDSIFYDTMHEDYAAESNSKLAKEHPKFYNAASATFILGQIFALAFLYNEGKEELTGAEGGALDPIGTIADAIKYYFDENLSFWEATVKVVEDIANQLPFASIVTGGGRLPIKEAFPDLLSVAKGEAKLGDEAWKLTNLLLPTGGGQLKKTTQGLSTFAKGGAYSKDSEGKEKLKYPVEQNLENLAKSALFGKWSTEGAKRYIESGFKALSANQTEGYEKAKKAGITDEQFYNAYNAQKKVEGLGDLTSLVKKNEIDKATRGLTQTKRKILYETFNIAKGEWDNSKVVSPYEIRTQREKLAREKLKTKKK